MTNTNALLSEQWPHALGQRDPYQTNARETYLNEMREWLEPAGYNITTEIRQGNIIETILSVAQHGFEIIVMTTHGRTGIARTVIGSITSAVLEHAPCPMLIVRAPDRADL
jgi:nucleotide-binding universal stress UspA family protein